MWLLWVFVKYEHQDFHRMFGSWTKIICKLWAWITYTFNDVRWLISCGWGLGKMNMVQFTCSMSFLLASENNTCNPSSKVERLSLLKIRTLICFYKGVCLTKAHYRMKQLFWVSSRKQFQLITYWWNFLRLPESEIWVWGWSNYS